MATGYQFQAFPAGTNANTTTGPGNQLGGDGSMVSTVVFGVVITGSATVNFEHTVDGTNWYPLACLDTSSVSGAKATSTASSGIFQADASGSLGVRPNVSANTGTVVVTANKVVG